MDLRKRVGHAGIVVAACFLLLAGESGAKTRPESPHSKKGNPKACLACHLSTPKAGATRREINLKFGGDLVALCGACHESYVHMHPVKIAVAPDMKSPEDLPLDKDGKISCITCHDMMEEHGIKRKRMMKGRALCLNCHFDSDILAQIVWYPARLKRGEKGKLEIKVSEFSVGRKKKATLGDSVLLYYTLKNVGTGKITFGTNILYDDGTRGDREAGDGIYTLEEVANESGKKVYTCWVLDSKGSRSNPVTIAVEYE